MKEKRRRIGRDCVSGAREKVFVIIMSWLVSGRRRRSTKINGRHFARRSAFWRRQTSLTDIYCRRFRYTRNRLYTQRNNIILHFYNYYYFLYIRTQGRACCIRRKDNYIIFLSISSSLDCRVPIPQRRQRQKKTICNKLRPKIKKEHT